MGLLTPVGEAGWAGGTLYYMPLSRDSFVHFAPLDRAEQIVASGKLLMNPPYPKMGIDAVAAISTVWGQYVPKTQTTHIKRGPDSPLVAVLFQTSVVPQASYPEEVLWKRDVSLKRPRVIPASTAVGMLKNTPETVGEDDMVTYERTAAKVAARFMAAYEKPEVPGEYADRCSNYIAAALGVCIPVELTHSWHLLGALRQAGWQFEVLPGKPGSWGTVRRFAKEHRRGVWAIETKGHIILVKNGEVFDYEGRGADGRRVKIAYRLWQ